MKKLVIIGGGFAGALVAKKLQKKFAITLIDTKAYFEFTPSILKIVRDRSLLRKIRVPHKKYLKHGTFIEGRVTRITEKSVFIDKNKISFDYLVIATGWSYGFIDYTVPAYSLSSLEANSNAIQKANKVLLIGGGPVGVELAAEFNNKKIILVDKSKHLLNRLDPKVGNYANTFLEKKGVEIIHNHAITDYNKTYITDQGKQVSADIAFLCTGFLPNSDIVRIFSPKVLDKKGFIKVNAFFQLPEYKHIFAVGNITNISEEKSAQNAEKEAQRLIQNLCLLVNNKPMVPYKEKVRPMVISLGPYDGLFVYKSFVFKGIIPALMKKIIEYKTLWKYKYF